MQTTTGTYDAAVASRDQQLAPPDVAVDWDRGGYGGTLDALGPDVQSVTVARSLATDLPEGVKHFTGSVAASATVTLQRKDDTGTNTTASHYSPLNPASPLYGYRRLAAPAKVELGFRTAAGVERLPVLNGVVRTLRVSRDSAELSLLDNVDKDFRRHLTMPMVLADDRTFGSPAQKPGLNAAWVVDWVMRRCGYYAAPPNRSSCILSATLAGSGYPEVGSIQEWRGANYSKLAFPPLTPGFSTAAKYVAGVALSGITSQQCDLVTTGSASVNDNGRLFMQCWARPNTGSLASGLTGSPMMAYRTGVSFPYASLYVDPNGRLQLLVERSSGWGQQSTGNAGPTGVTTGAWHYLAAYIEFGSTTRCWLRVDGTQTGPHTLGSGSVSSIANMNTVSLRGKGAGFADATFDGIVEAVQVGTEDNSGSAPSWDDAWQPTYDHGGSLNELVATPVVDSEEAAAILGELAAAELGMWGTSEGGRPFWRTRRFWTTAPQTTSQETVTTTDKITDLELVEDVDAVRNKWVVKAAPPQVGSPTTDVWSLEEYWRVPASGSITKWANFDQPAAYLDTTVTSHGSAGESRYNASRGKNGTGGIVSNLGVTVTAFAQSAKLVISNPNGFDAWVVGDAAQTGVSQGVPSLRLVGQPVLFDVDQTIQTKLRTEASDSASIGLYGERVYEYPDNRWLQDSDSLDLTAADGLAMTKDPKVVISNLRVVGNTARQVGDRFRIQDPTGTMLDGEWHRSAITTEQSADGGLTQTLETRAV